MEAKKDSLQGKSLKDMKVPLQRQSSTVGYENRRVSKREVPKVPVQGQRDDCKLEVFTEIKKKKQYQDIKFIITCLRNHFVFYRLQDTDLEKLVNEMFYCEIKVNDSIINQGDNASSFFILEKGKIQVLVNNEPKRVITQGEGFGELALLYNAPRSATCKALEQCFLWGIDRNTFKKIVEQMVLKEFDENRKFIENIKFFQSLTTQQKDSIANVLIDLKFAKDQPIVNEKDIATSFYIIKEGLVSVMKDDKEVKTLQKGDSFGENALLQGDQYRSMTIKAKEETKCIALGKDVVQKILGSQIENIFFRNIAKWTIEKTDGLRELNQIQQDKLIDLIQFIRSKDGETLIKKGASIQNQCYLILDGELCLRSDKDKKDKYYTKFKNFLVQEMIASQKHVVPEDFICVKASTVGLIDLNKFAKDYGSTLQDILTKNRQLDQLKIQDEKKIKEEIQQIKIPELVVLKHLGAGQFGSVYMVKPKQSKSLYALKCISKKSVVEQTLERHLQQEKEVMEITNFSFIMRFMRSFQDEYYIYFLLEFIKGMELFDVIREIGLLSTADSQFYIGSMILILENLHGQNILYRDIKPENIMISEKGFMKLIDMGTAKIMKSETGLKARTFTIIGTPHYMAPEVISGKGYNFYVDLWSVGICLYEFMCGYVPFGEEAEDPYEIYEEIIKNELTYPNYLHDKKAKSLMEQLLSKTPDLRLGGSYANLKSHQWFAKFDWEKLLYQTMEPPWAPPKEKMLSEADISKLEKMGKSVIDEIRNEVGGQFQKPPASKVPNWDKIY